MMIHVRYDGFSRQFCKEELSLTNSAQDTAIKQRIAGAMGLRAGSLKGYIVDRRPSGNWIVRPEAVYG